MRTELAAVDCEPMMRLRSLVLACAVASTACEDSTSPGPGTTSDASAIDASASDASAPGTTTGGSLCDKLTEQEVEAATSLDLAPCVSNVSGTTWRLQNWQLGTPFKGVLFGTLEQTFEQATFPPDLRVSIPNVPYKVALDLLDMHVTFEKGGKVYRIQCDGALKVNESADAAIQDALVKEGKKMDLRHAEPGLTQAEAEAAWKQESSCALHLTMLVAPRL